MVMQIKESLLHRAVVLVEALEAVSQNREFREICLSTDLSGGRRVNFILARCGLMENLNCLLHFTIKTENI